MPQRVTVVDYDPSWPQRFWEERDRLCGALGEAALAIWHIGSTSVPGLAAKPVVDVLVAARSLEEVDAAEPRMRELGYECLGEFGIPGRRYFRKGGDERTHQVHVFDAGDRENVIRHLALCDYLRSHEGTRDEYAALKRSLARRFPYDIEGYCDGKDRFARAGGAGSRVLRRRVGPSLPRRPERAAPPRGLPARGGGLRRGGAAHGGRQRLRGRLHRHGVLARDVRGALGDRSHGHGGGVADSKDRRRHAGRACRDAVRGMPRAHDAARPRGAGGRGASRLRVPTHGSARRAGAGMVGGRAHGALTRPSLGCRRADRGRLEEWGNRVVCGFAGIR